MSATSIVRLALVLYCGLAAFSIWLLFRNAAASDSVKNSAIALTSVFPLLISVLPYMSPEILEKKMTFVLLRDSKTNSVIAGEDRNAYGHSYFHMFTDLGQFPDALKGSDEEIIGNKGLDLIEKGIVESLIANFLPHWDLIRTERLRDQLLNSCIHMDGCDAEEGDINVGASKPLQSQSPYLKPQYSGIQKFQRSPEKHFGRDPDTGRERTGIFKDDYDRKPLRHSHDSDSIEFTGARTTGHLGNSVTRSSRYE